MKRILLLTLAVCVVLFALTGCRASGNITTDKNTADGRVDGNGSRDGVIDDDNGTAVHGGVETGSGNSANGGMNANSGGTGGIGTNSGSSNGSGGSTGSSGGSGGGTGSSTGSNGTGIGPGSAG